MRRNPGATTPISTRTRAQDAVEAIKITIAASIILGSIVNYAIIFGLVGAAIIIFALYRVAEDSKKDALQALDKIVTELGMEKDAPFMRAKIDGSMSPEAIKEGLEACQQERAERIVRGIGENVLNSDTAARMRDFLQELSREHKGEEATTPEAMGLLYLKIMEYAHDNPETEVGKTFRKLADEMPEPHEEEAT